ncbi:S9 family peptidase [Steroidobacter sp. S1-65]|uniref:Acyl-peptide hydrolase n=1 Tax=Steroidobacter gossypii TaxID=2805490 RepID=A0ABS1WSX8_9GAMM|nr:S9 family peptidase [Steroidobacter gossypii]MBM0104082.1 S9 family peptidase [Steroidobacter gossypii]
MSNATLRVLFHALLLALATCQFMPSPAAAAERRLLTAEDIIAVRNVSDPQLSPDGQWVAYEVRTADPVKDKSNTHIWMSSWDGKQSVQLTYSEDSEHSPRWSPDGKYLGFLTARGEDEPPEQVWLLDRQGGEAKPLTGFNGEVIEFSWSPDGKKLALIVADEDPRKQRGADKDKTPPPIVIDRYYFKEDGSGYLGSQRRHLYVFDVASRQADNLTPDRFDESAPSWSPDGSRIAFYSNRSDDPDRNSEFGLYTIEPRAGATPQLVTKFQGDTGDTSWMSPPAWRPDGRELAFLTAGDPKLIYYSLHNLAIVPAGGGAARIVTKELDRNVIEPQWSADGASIYFLLEDDRNQVLARINVGNGRIDRLLNGRRESTDYDLGSKGRIALLDSTVDTPNTVYALEGKRLRALSHHNDDWLAGVNLGTTEEISFSSKDGTRVSGFVVKPPGFVAGRRYPTLLWIHGGPVSQYANSFMLPWQIFASQGYVVVAANPRGSSGRGEAYTTAIYKDWGGKDSEDVLAAVDYVVQQGIADANRLGVGGWSYGGILTNVVIAKDTRFKSATSGASISNVLAGYGTDMYIREYEMELGLPWKDLDTYLHNSYAFLHADRIKTPTLFLCGDQDFNVPLLNSEQMYQALRSLGVPTQLVIYPGENHGIRKPSYQKDRMQRYLDWHGKYLQPTSS